MAYFSNSSEGMVLDDQCSRCKLSTGDLPCPILMAQMNYNYEACGNSIATAILNDIVAPGGACQMFSRFPDLLAV